MKTAMPTGKPTTQRINRYACARQNPSRKSPRNQAQNPAPDGGPGSARASTSSSERAISASTAVKPRVMNDSPISRGITNGVINSPRQMLHPVTSATNHTSPSGTAETM
jgi:hypothetical protein